MRVGRWEAEHDLYQILGVPPHAGTEEIRRAHKRLVRLHHPDRASRQASPETSEAEMKRINHAASVLLDPSARASYDNLRRTPRPAPRPAAPPPPAWYEAPPSPPSRASAPQPPSWFDGLFRVATAPRGLAPIPVSLFAFALLFPILLALVAPLFGGPVPVSSPDYRIPKPPQRVTMWAP